MAFKVNNSDGFVGRKLYKGIAPIKVVAVCPTKEVITKLTGKEPQYEVKYVDTVDFGNGPIKTVNITFFVDTVNDLIKNCRLTFKLYKQPVISKDGKYKVMDTFGRTGWVTVDELRNHVIPKWSNGEPAHICADYRPLFKGEENLEQFIRSWFNIYDVEVYDADTKKFVMRNGDTLEKARGILEDPSKLFNGDFSELNACVIDGKDNVAKALFGVKTGQDGKQYQDIFLDAFVRNVIGENKTIKTFTDTLEDVKSRGKYPSSDFEICSLTEFKVTPTDFSANSADMNKFDPFGDNESPESTTVGDDDDDLPFGGPNEDPLAAFGN